MKIFAGIAVAVLTLLAGSFGLNTAFSWLNQPSNVAVFAGVLMLLAVAGAATAVALALHQYARKIGVLLALVMVGAGCTKVTPGHVGINVNNYGDQPGVDDFPLVTGRVWYNPFTTDVYKYPTYLQSVVWTQDDREDSKHDESITFNSVEGAVVGADIAMSVGLEGDSVPSLFVEFRKPIDHVMGVYLRSRVRDAFSKHASTMKVTQIFGAGKQVLLDAAMATVDSQEFRAGLETQLRADGIGGPSS